MKCRSGLSVMQMRAEGGDCRPGEAGRRPGEAGRGREEAGRRPVKRVMEQPCRTQPADVAAFLFWFNVLNI